MKKWVVNYFLMKLALGESGLDQVFAFNVVVQYAVCVREMSKQVSLVWQEVHSRFDLNTAKVGHDPFPCGNPAFSIGKNKVTISKWKLT